MDEADPMDVQCPACFSKPGEDCTQATSTGRKDVTWFHLSRITLAEEEAGD
jgi:hypothetical protein